MTGARTTSGEAARPYEHGEPRGDRARAAQAGAPEAGDPDAMPVLYQATEKLAERVRVGSVLIALGIMASSLSDIVFLGGEHPNVYVAQGLQFAIVVTLYICCLRRPAWAGGIALIGLSVVCIGTAAAGIATDDDTTSGLLLIALIVGSASLLPWDPRQQAAVAAIALLAILANMYGVSGRIDLSIRYPTLVAASLTFATSVYIAHRLARMRVKAAVAEGGRAQAELSLRRAHAELERRVDERTAELRLANQALEAEIAERERAQHEARQHQAELAHVTRLATMGQMAAEMAHELNQPLAAISSYAQGCAHRLRAGAAPTERLLPTLQEIAAQALRAGDVVHRMAAFTRKRAALLAKRDLRDVVRDASHFLDSEAERQGVAVRLDLTSTPLPVTVDALQIEQLIVNLMRNAFDAMKGNNGRVRQLCVSTAVVEPTTVEVSICDSGEGISPSIAAQIFEPFFTTKPDALGLGLSMSRSIVEAHGGRIWATANASPGATLHFTLPLVLGSTSAPPAAEG